MTRQDQATARRPIQPMPQRWRLGQPELKQVEILLKVMLAPIGGMDRNAGRLVHDQAMLLSPLSTVILAEGMVATVEPGVYIEGFGGVRIEDDVVVTEGGAERLTHFTRELLEVG